MKSAHPIDPALTAIAIAYKNQGYIADMVVPRIPVGKQDFKFMQYATDQNYNVPDTLVGRKSRPNQVELTSTEVTDSTVDQPPRRRDQAVPARLGVIAGLAGARLYAAIGLAAAFALLLAWALRLEDLRGDWQAKHGALTRSAGSVLASIRAATGNPKLLLRDAADQVDLLGRARREWRGVAKEQSGRINELGLETAKLKALNADLRVKAEAQIAKRQAVVTRLESAALDPGERADCERQLRDVEAALDAVYEEGL